MEKLLTENACIVERITLKNNENTQDLIVVQTKLNKILDLYGPKSKKSEPSDLVNLCSDETSRQSKAGGSKRSKAVPKTNKGSNEKDEKTKNVNNKKASKKNDNSEDQSSYIGYGKNIENSRHIMEQIDSNIPNYKDDDKENDNNDLDLNENRKKTDPKKKSSLKQTISKKNDSLPNVSPIQKVNQSHNENYTISNMSLNKKANDKKLVMVQKNYTEKKKGINSPEVIRMNTTSEPISQNNFAENCNKEPSIKDENSEDTFTQLRRKNLQYDKILMEEEGRSIKNPSKNDDNIFKEKETLNNPTDTVEDIPKDKKIQKSSTQNFEDIFKEKEIHKNPTQNVEDIFSKEKEIPKNPTKNVENKKKEINKNPTQIVEDISKVNRIQKNPQNVEQITKEIETKIKHKLLDDDDEKLDTSIIIDDSSVKYMGNYSSKSKNRVDYDYNYYLSAYLLPMIGVNTDFDPLDFFHSIPVEITSIDIPYYLGSGHFCNQIYFTVKTEEDYEKVKDKTYISIKYTKMNHYYFISEKILTLDEMREMKMGNNLEPNESRYWTDFSNCKNAFDYFDFFTSLKNARGSNIIEFASLTFKKGKISYAHFNFKKTALKLFGWEESKKCHIHCFNGDILYFKLNSNRKIPGLDK